MYPIVNQNVYKCNLNLKNLNGQNGFTILSPYQGSWLGYSINFINDINGDQIDDLVIGAPNSSPPNFEAGQSYIIFGSNKGFSANFNITNLNGSNGFAISGISPEDNSGWSVGSAGDINGDGINDILIGAPNAIFGFGPGEVYVIFGRSNPFPAVFDLSAINGTNGFIISGVEESDNLGFSVSSAGDVNNDGLDDILIGNPLNYPYGQGGLGQAYIIYGSTASFNKVFYITNLNGVNGFTLSGDMSHNVVLTGWSVAGLGDVNGDKIDDIIIGAPGFNNQYAFSSAYILFGNAGGFSAVIDLYTLNGNNGFGFYANSQYNQDGIGVSVSGAGDLNGDGINDILIGTNSSQNYIIFGSKSAFPATLSPTFLNGKNGFTIQSLAVSSTYWSVSGVGDVNVDGFDDILVANSGLNNQTGISYVIYGNNTFNQTITLESLDSTTGYQIYGMNSGDQSGVSISGRGDLNADGISDMLIGANEANEGYIVFGSQSSSNIPCYLVPSSTPTPSPTASITSSPSSTSTPSITPSCSPIYHSDNGISGGEIAGIAVGAAVGVALLGAAMFWYSKTHGWCSGDHHAEYGALN